MTPRSAPRLYQFYSWCADTKIPELQHGHHDRDLVAGDPGVPAHRA